MPGSDRDKPRTGHCGTYDGSTYDGMLPVGAEATPVLGIDGMTEINEASS